MKKKYVILIVVLVLILILILPIRNVLKDGGSVEYKALIYKVTKLKELNQDYEDGLKKGIVIELFGKQIYEKITSKVKDKSQNNVHYIDEDISLDTGHSMEFKEGLIVVKQNDLYGFMNTKGEIVIKPIYFNVFPFTNGVSRIMLQPGNRHGYIDRNGNELSKIEYGYANDFSENYGLVCINEIDSFQEPCDPTALLDKGGNIVIDSRNKDYNLVNDVHDSLISAKKDGKYGFVDINGNVVIDFKYKSALSFNYGYSVVYTLDDKKFVIDKNDKQVLDLSSYDNAYFINDSLIKVEKENKWGVLDLTGKKVIDTIYNILNEEYENYNGYFLAANNPNEYVLLDENGELVLDLKDYDMAGSINDDLISVRKNDKWGFIDFKGDVIIDLEYDVISGFSEGILYVEKEGKEMFIDKKGNIVLTYR